LDEENKGYRMVQGSMGVTSTYLPGMWSASTTLLQDVRLAYHYQRKLSESEESSRKLYDLLYLMSSAMGIWEEDGDEDIFGSDGDC
jgi:hypothetical protein